MSSLFVRQSLIDFLESDSSENVIDMTDEFQELQDMIASKGLTNSDPWLGVQFVGSTETPVDIGATNSRGKYREEGVIYLHIVDVAKIGAANAILTRAENLRNLLRGRRINGTVIVEGVSPPVFGEGATLSFSGGYSSATVTVEYQRDLDL